MNIAVVGTGYVGLVSGSCFAERGHQVFCVDKDEAKIEGLKQGVIPIYEKDLKEIVVRNYEENRLHFTTSLKEAVQDAEVVFIAVGTPQAASGEADMRYVYAVADELGEVIQDQKYRVIVDKSTVPVGTADEVHKRIKDKNEHAQIEVCSVPEFLKEGTAVYDTLNPDRIIIGTQSKQAEGVLTKLHHAFSDQIMVTDVRSAEMIKYASNSFLATKISFINEMANLCDAYGANVKEVAKGMGLDKRISPKFLNAGLGFGGSCFPKDISAMVKMGERVQYNTTLLKAVQAVNAQQKSRIKVHLDRIFNDDLKGRKIGVLGLAFKPETDDIREAPAIDIIQELVNHGAEVLAYDPIAMPNARKVLPDAVHLVDKAEACFDQADAVTVITEWKEIIALPFGELKNKMKMPVLIDGRNALDAEALKAQGYIYHGIGVQ